MSVVLVYPDVGSNDGWIRLRCRRVGEILDGQVKLHEPVGPQDLLLIAQTVVAEQGENHDRHD